MPGLQNKLEDYLRIVNFTMRYELQDNSIIQFKFSKKSFPHMLGLHKLKDIPLIQKFNNPLDKMVSANYLIGKIKKGDLTEKDIQKSVYYNQIQKRYIRFDAENLFGLTYTDVIVDFDVNKLANSKLTNTKYILYEAEQEGYKQLCIAGKGLNEYYAETFFFESSDDYIRNQKTVKVKTVQMIAPDGTIYLEDEFK